MVNANDTNTPTTLNPGETYESATWRVRRGSLGLTATHIMNAGKRGKKCLKIVLYCPSAKAVLDLDAETSALLRKASRDVSEESMLALAKTCQHADLDLDITYERGVDVQPAGCAGAVEITGVNVRVRATSTGFAITNLRDTANEETMIQKDKTGIALVLAWARKNASAISGMTFAEVRAALSGFGVRTHYYCAMD